jgi:nucleoid DNA-binding protein
MSLNKQKMVREIGRRTRLPNRDVQRVIEALVEVWKEEMVDGGRIELEQFLVLQVIEIERASTNAVKQRIRLVKLRASRHLRQQLNGNG